MDWLEKATRDINFNLNRIAPENLKEISNEIAPFAKEDKDKCELLISLIIEKSWDQPKYASSYAKLCSNFAKIEESKFQFEIPGLKKDKKTNQFKHLLIERVQHSFDKKEELHTEFEDEFAKETYLKDVKKNMLGNVKFLGELIKSKVIRKKTIKYCVSRLLSCFLWEYHKFTVTQEFQYSYYDYQFEALIEFLENLGDRYESIDEEKEEGGSIAEAEKVMKQLTEDPTKEPPQPVVEEFTNLKANEYFKLFIIVDQNILSKKKGRISALLKNLEERRDNKWKKHHVEAEGPKKLKDIRADDDLEPEQKMRNDLAKLDDTMNKILKKVQEADNSWGHDLEKIAKSYEPGDILTSYLKLVAEEKKEPVLKRLEMFKIIVDKHYQAKGFRQAWENAIKSLALLSSDIPFCSAALAKIL